MCGLGTPKPYTRLAGPKVHLTKVRLKGPGVLGIPELLTRLLGLSQGAQPQQESYQ